MVRDRNKAKASEKPGRTQFIMMFFAFSFGMILSNLIAQSSAQKVEQEQAPLFIYKGIDKSIDDISLELKERILQLEDRKRQMLELAAIQMHVHQYASDNEMSLKEAGEALFPSAERVAQESQISQFYHDNQEGLAKPFYQVKEEIKARLEFENIAKMKLELLNELKKSGDLAILPNR